MRITHRMIINNAIQQMEMNKDRLAELQSRFSSGKNINKVSDDPSTAIMSLSLRSSIKKSDAFMDIAENTASWMDANEMAMQQMTKVAMRVLNLVQNGISDTTGDNERLLLGEETNELLGEALQIGNSKHNDDYIFAGFLTQTKPFDLTAGSPDTVTYQGDAGVLNRAIAPGQVVRVNLDGPATFADLFDSVIRSRDALLNNDMAEIEAAIGDVQDALETLNSSTTMNGARKRQVNFSMERTESTKIELRKLLSKKEDASMTEVITDLQHQEVVYQASLEAGVRSISLPSLFSFLS